LCSFTDNNLFILKGLYLILFALLIAGCKKEKASTVNSQLAATELVSTAHLKSLKINGADCALDTSTNTFYFPVTTGATLNNYKVSFDTSTTAVMFDNVKAVNNATVSYPLITNQQVKIQALDKFNKAINFTLIITGMAIVELNTGQAIGDDSVKGTFNIINPNYVAQNSQLEISSNISIAIRGATSRVYPKNSYLMHLIDAQGNASDVSLLGLRTDNSWILDAEYIDQARMRNRVCTDIWNSFNNVPYIASEPTAFNGTRGYMSEVILNNKYWGLYCFTEKLDRKQLQLNKTYGDMYKAEENIPTVSFYDASIPYDNSSDTWAGWELEYPDLGDTPAPNWGYLFNIQNFVASATDGQFSNQIASMVDINNMVDYYIFYNTIEGLDNQAKNTYFSFYNYKTDGNFFYSPWDLDGTLGRNYDGTYLPSAIIGPSGNNLFLRLVNLNPDNYKQLLKARWNSLKTNQLSVTTVTASIEAYRALLVNTNAFAREMATWNNITQNLNTETSYIETWYSAQYNLMDSYINGL